MGLGICAQKGKFPTHHAHLTVAAHRIVYHPVKDIDGWDKDDRVAIVHLDTVLTEDLTTPSIVEDALTNDALTATKLLAYRIVDVSVRGEFNDRKTALRHPRYARFQDQPPLEASAHAE